ncbi:MAG: thioredoxin [Saprospiraceae bacterium]
MALEFTDANFKADVLDSDKLTVIDFWAVWCGPCKMVSPIIDELANEYGKDVNIGKMDVDTNPAISGEYGVRSIPTVLYIKGGEVVDKIVGATTKANYEAKMKEHMA